jgi:hypothetical protein
MTIEEKEVYLTLRGWRPFKPELINKGTQSYQLWESPPHTKFRLMFLDTAMKSEGIDIQE